MIPKAVSGSILDGNSSGCFFRDYLDRRIEEDRFDVQYKIYQIGDGKFNAAMLTEAMCKMMGFIYDPSEEQYQEQYKSLYWHAPRLNK